LGGGIRNIAAVRNALNAGVSRVIIGTAAYTDPDFLADALAKFGAERVIAGVDSVDGFAAIKGWVEKSPLSASDMVLKMKDAGIKTVVFTDVSRDGALTGVNIPLTVRIKKESGLEIIASGGLSSLAEITELKSAEIDGLILGKAIFEKRFTIKEALNASC
jgi:phosphoribosylformimino-5-aminoimidazole carboxamide ribotide isomerase